MATYDYDDLRMTFRRADDGTYRVSAAANAGTPVAASFALPMTTASLEQAISRLGMGRGREVATVDDQATESVNAELFGTQLGTALFDGPLGPLYDNARAAAAERGRGLRLTLSLADTPELLGVPWELLYRRPTFLASQRRTPIVRYLDVGVVPPPLRIDGPVRVLGVVASPQGAEALKTEDERDRVETALQSMVQRGLVELEWCDPATPKTLRQKLRDGSFHILHYIGHSDFTEAGDGVILLENESGGPARISEAGLAMLLGDQTSLRLAVLNSCDGARTTLTDPFAGIATSLVRLGVPAVIAMQFRITDQAAIVFADELFTSLIGRQFPIDAAVAEARKAVFTEVNEIEWATPVLFLRATDSDLFDFSHAPAPIPVSTPPAPLTPVEPVLPTDPDRTEGDAPTKRKRPPRPPRLALIAALVVFIAIVGGLAWVLLPLGDDHAAASCGGEPVPAPPPYDGPGGDVGASFEYAQDWASLGASAQPGDDEGNDAIWAKMKARYPDTFARAWLDVGAKRQEAVTLLYLDAARDASAASFPVGDPRRSRIALDVIGMYYENATDTAPCRTSFNCVRFTVDPRRGQIVDRQASGLTLTQDSDDLNWPDEWVAPTDPAGMGSGQNVEAYLSDICKDATFE